MMRGAGRFIIALLVLAVVVILGLAIFQEADEGPLESAEEKIDEAVDDVDDELN